MDDRPVSPLVSPVIHHEDWRFSAICALFEQAFPASERKPLGFLTEIFEREDYSLIAYTIEDQLIGFSILYQSNLGFGLLEYMAVTASIRGKGHGRILFLESSQFCAGPIILEVEAPKNQDKDAVESRRIDFYQRLGCRIVPQLKYKMPRVGSEEPPPMQLMLFRYPDASIPSENLRYWVTDIYRNVYGKKESEVVVNSMFASLPSTLVL